MCSKKVVQTYTTRVSDSFDKTDENCNYEPAFRRWLIREIEEGKMTVSEAIQQFNFNPENGRYLIRDWRQKYASEMVLSSPEMTESEKQQMAMLQKQVKAMAKALEDARMKNIALNMLIDVAEDKLNISIRKKPGAKQ
jgi:transposase-like protein